MVFRVCGALPAPCPLHPGGELWRVAEPWAELDCVSPVSMLLMAGLCVLFSCLMVLFFHTPYRRLQAEADANPSIQEDTCPATSDPSDHAPHPAATL